ncbi:hypothetical protein HDU97_004669 [Phlyctochytrium planicorne]|nr:hypothetical protein HDU97_004669 [Phlyctochytrium planicorne]
MKYKGLTTDEEIAARGGLAEGFDAITIKPKKGKALIFSQNVIHEAKPLIPWNIKATKTRVGYKQKWKPSDPYTYYPLFKCNPERIILRTDIMVKRAVGAKGFVVSEEETSDYQMALSYFREAQRMELKKNVARAGELYERLPSEILIRIAEVMNPFDCQKLVLAFPDLFWLQQATESYHSSLLAKANIYTKIAKTKIPKPPTSEPPPEGEFSWPEIKDCYGTSCGLVFPEAAFFRENIEGCCRAAALLAFFQLGHCHDIETYTVSYNPVNQEVKAVDFKQVVAAAFYNRPLYGAIFKVTTKSPGKPDPLVDFNHSVDRTFMTYRFGAQFVGSDMARNLHANASKKPWTSFTARAEQEESDEEEEEVPEFTIAKDLDEGECEGSGELTDETDDGDEATERARDGKEDVDFEVDQDEEGEDDEEDQDENDLEDGVQGFVEVSPPFVDDYYAVEKSYRHLFASLARVQRFMADELHYGPNRMEVVLAKRKKGVMSEYREAITYPKAGGRELSTLVDFNGELDPCFCRISDGTFGTKSKLARPINDLVFDFSRYELTVSPEDSSEARPDSCASCPLVVKNPSAVFPSIQEHIAGINDEILRFKVDISPLTKSDSFESFKHAGSCLCGFDDLEANILEIVDYTHLNHVHLMCQERGDGQMWVYAVYGGVAAL